VLLNLNASTIAPYGRLVPQTLQADYQTITIDGSSGCGFFYSPSSVLLAPGEQMAALQVLGEDKHPISFYVDKEIELLPEVPFAFFSLDGSCTVRIQTDAVLTTLETPTPEPLQNLHGEITVRCICTFFFQEHGPSFFFAGERHSAYELLYVTQGRLHTLVDGRDYVLEQNEALFIAPDLWHVQFGEENEDVSFLVCSFFVESPLPSAMLLRVFPARGRTTKLVEMLRQEYWDQSVYWDDLLVSLLQSLLAYYARSAVDCGTVALQTPSSRRNDNLILNRAVEYVAEHIYEKISVDQLARYCCISSTFLSTLFQRHLGISPGAYILRARLEESRLLIKCGYGNMAEIASRLHFSSPPHFSSAFRRLYGMTPTAYAKGQK